MATAVSILKTDESGEAVKTMVEIEAIERVIKNNKIEDKPVVVIAIAGKARKGKSYLLSVMIAYLEHMLESPNEPFKPSASQITGMKWKLGRTSVTQGMWLWEKAFPIKRKDESEVAVLLIDTQGLCDDTNSADPMIDCQIIYTTLSIASIYIHNVSGDFQMPEKRAYQFCKSFSEVFDEDRNTDPLCHSFILLFRDWVDDENYGCRPELFNEEIIKAERNQEAKKIMHAIDMVFRNKTAWVFAEPSEALKKCRSSLSLEEAGEDFRNCVLSFLKALFSPDGEYSQHMYHTVTGKIMLATMKLISGKLENFPGIQSDADYLKSLFMDQKHQKAMQMFESIWKAVDHEHDIDTIEDELGEAKKSALQYFEEETRKCNPHEKQFRYCYDHLSAILEEEMQSHLLVARCKRQSRSGALSCWTCVPESMLKQCFC